MDGFTPDLAPLAVIAFDGHFLAKMITHIVAFLIFMWVLKKYAYRPLTEIMDNRKQAIDDQYRKVDELRTQAEEIETQYEAKMRDIDNDARRHVQEAVASGDKLKNEILAKARADSEEMRQKAERALELEVAKARIEMRDEVVAMTIAATEKLLSETVDRDRSRRLVGDFIEQVQGLPRGGNGSDT